MSGIQSSIRYQKEKAKEKLKETAERVQYKASEHLPRKVKIAMDRQIHLLQKKLAKEPNLSGNSNVIFRQTGVFLHTGSGADDTQDVIPGVIYLYEKPEGLFIEWKRLRESSDGEWDVIDDKQVNYTPSASGSSESVQFSQPDRHQHLVCFELSDLRSVRFSRRQLSWSYVIFILEDGRTFPPLHFHSGGSKELKQALSHRLNLVRSRDDKELYVVEKHDVEALKRSFHELELFPDQKHSLVSRFVSNPYVTTMSGFSKVSSLMKDYFLVPEAGESTAAQMLTSDLGAIELTTQQAESGYEVVSKRSLGTRPRIVRETPVTQDEWRAAQDEEGRVIDPESLTHRIFRGGIEPSLRPQLWCFQLAVFNWSSTEAERQVLRKQKTNQYYEMKLQWKTISEEQAKRNSRFRDHRSLVEKDVLRTDRTHPFYEGENNKNIDKLRDILMTFCMYDWDMGYVQGMSDLLSPLLLVLNDEVDAFWCFVGFMNLVGRNFELDQSHMKKQLADLRDILEFVDPELCNYLDSHESSNMFFCFRWLLILFKREFSLTDSMRLWEVLWTGKPCTNFHLLLCVSILQLQKSTLINNRFGFTEILKHVNDLSLQIPLNRVLTDAEALFVQLSETSSRPNNVSLLLGMPVTAARSEDGSPVRAASDSEQNGTESSGCIEGEGLVQQRQPPARPPLPKGVDLGSSWPGTARPCSLEADYVVTEGAEPGSRSEAADDDLDSSIEVLSETAEQLQSF